MFNTIENDYLKVTVNSLGSELWSIIIKKDGRECLWQGEADLWPRRAPVLFPHCGKLKDNQYVYKGNIYKSPQHGFARDFEHEITEQDNTSITYLFSYNDETLKNYPFKFKLYDTYKLNKNILSQILKVVNAGEEEMYFSIGYHTGLKCPFDDKHTAPDYSFVFDKMETPEEMLVQDGLITGEKRTYFKDQNVIKLHDKLFPASFTLTGLKSDYVTLVEEDTGRYIRVGIKDFPSTTFWSTYEKIKFVCIEPWYGLPDPIDTDGQLTGKPGIMKLNPGESFTCEQTLELG